MALGDILYRPGISFINARPTRPVIPVGRLPWHKRVHPYTGGPLDMGSKEARWNTGEVRGYKPVWKRRSRAKNVERLGAYFADVPDAFELGLGQAPGATDKESTTSRSPIGFLQSLITQATDLAQIELRRRTEAQRQKAEAAAARIQVLTLPTMEETTGFLTGNWPLILGIGAIGIVATTFMGRRRRRR